MQQGRETEDRKILTFDFTPVAIDTTTCFTLPCLRGSNVECPSDIFIPLHTKDTLPFSASHRNVSVDKFRHRLLIWLRFSYTHYIMPPSVPFFNQSVLQIVLFAAQEN